MRKQVLFIHGGGDEGDVCDARMVSALQAALGQDYEIIYPPMPWEDKTPDFGWGRGIGTEIEKLSDNAFWVGHSLGASMLLKWLSENKTSKKPAGIFLLAPPFWSGHEPWKQGIKLQKDFAANLPKNNRIFFYHCQDDEVVTLQQLAIYRQELPEATFRDLQNGGHQLDNNLKWVAKDIKDL